MSTNRISVITVVYNAAALLERTILSIIGQTYQDIEYIIIDGGSTDGTLDIIRKYEDRISYWISEPDKGIYDAMNKGVKHAGGEWINFMNAGDIFFDDNVLANIFSSQLAPHIEFIYSDFYVARSYFPGGQARFIADFEKGIVLHQSVIYKKKLHAIYGYYKVTSRIIISDYLFFSAIPNEIVHKSEVPISLNDAEGVSQGAWCFYQKKCADYIFGKISFRQMLAATFVYKIKLVLRRLLGKSIVGMIERRKYKNARQVSL